MMATPAPSTPGKVISTSSAPTTPVSVKPTFDSVKWEKVSKLTSKQNELITTIGKLTQERPIPAKFKKLKEEEKPKQETVEVLSSIDDVCKFNEWFSTLESEDPDKTAHNEFLERMKSYRDWTNEIIQNTEEAISYVTEIEKQYSSVTTKTAELHRLCQELVKQEVQLVKVADSMSTQLEYFNSLDQMTKRFYSPTVSVLEDRFIPYLARLDECIQFIQAHGSFKESETYLIKFRLIQNRAMTLVKNHIVASMKATTNQIIAQLAAAPNPLEHKDAVYFVKYKSLAQKLKSLCEEIENRASVKEYAALLDDCNYTYIQQRRSLLLDIVYNHTRKLTTLPELREMVTSGCTYLLDVCHQETMLYLEFFKNPSNNLFNLLEEFATILYEAVRPIYIQVRVIEVLCTVVELLRSVIDQINQKGVSVSAFKPIAMRMLEDIQERLTYLAQTYIRDEVRSYQALKQDLDYPNKLSAQVTSSPTIVPEIDFPPSPAITPDTSLPTSLSSSSIPSSVYSPSNLSVSTILNTSGDLSRSAKASVDNSLRALLQMSMKNIYATCYPTLQRTIALLTKLYLAVDMTVFEGLAHEAVSACTETLLSAGRMITAQKGNIDGHLFVIKHLLVLSSQLTYFDISFAVIEKQVDFSQFKHSIRKLLTGQAGGSLFSLSFQNPLLTVVQSPRVYDSQIDTKKELEKQYWATVDAFVKHVSTFAVEPLTTFMSKVDQFLNSKKTPVAPAHLSNQPFLRPDDLDAALLQFTNNLHKWLGGANGVVSQLYLYLPHPDVTNLLLLIRSKITDTVDQMRSLMNTHYATHTHLQIISSEALSALFELWWHQDNNPTLTSSQTNNNNNNNSNQNNNNNNTTTNTNTNNNTNNSTDSTDIQTNTNQVSNTNTLVKPILTNDLIQPGASIPAGEAEGLSMWSAASPKLSMASNEVLPPFTNNSSTHANGDSQSIPQ